MSGRNKGKAKIHMSKPELPPFLQRMKEQIVANEDADRKEQSQRKRKDRPGRADDPDDDPTIVKLGDDDLTEEDYKRLKEDLDAQYKIDSEKDKEKPIEIDMDKFVSARQTERKDLSSNSNEGSKKSKATVELNRKDNKKSTKNLSFGYSSSSSEAED